MRSDNGVPFASPNGLFNLSRLSVWWLRLGISIERIRPGHPQQNGRHERMHLTLKKEATRLQVFLFALVDDLRADLTTALQNCRNDSLALCTAAPSLEFPRLIFGGVSRFAADESFVYFDFARQLASRIFILHSKPNPMKHEPRGFLSDTKRTVNLPRANAILGSGDNQCRVGRLHLQRKTGCVAAG